MTNEFIRNVAIIAHVDHGKTTLVDQMLKQGGVFRSNQAVAERVMDNNALEKERGITILAKNTSVKYGKYKINVVDTPGHADFGGEVERVLKMVNGVLLLVDAAEGPMPQTRFVLQKAMELERKVIIVINKIDRPSARIKEAVDEVLLLLMDLNASDEQLNSPIVYCSGRAGTSTLDMKVEPRDFTPLFETIIKHIDAPRGDDTLPLQMLVSALDYNDYVGTIAVGMIERGRLVQNKQTVICNFHTGKRETAKISSILQFEGLNRVPVTEAGVGDIVCVSGVEGVTIGDTICDVQAPEPLPFVKITEPSVEMTFSVNDSPFAGREGKFVTSRHLRDRLFKETIKDVSIKVAETDTSEAYKVSGRGEMHLAILIENMRREGYEFQVSMPRVLYRDVDGKRHEPIDNLIIDVPEASVGAIMEDMGTRKGELVGMSPLGSRIRMEFKIPIRGLFGYKTEFLTNTKGEGVMNSIFLGYEEYKGEITRRAFGSLVAHEPGEAVTYGLYYAQERGALMITPGTPVYEGMVVGMNAKAGDIVVNVCKKKQMSNMRSSSSDEALRLVTPIILSLEQALEFLSDDELLEVTPKSMRIRKKILDKDLRAKASKK
jgi:GTP-binding protein